MAVNMENARVEIFSLYRTCRSIRAMSAHQMCISTALALYKGMDFSIPYFKFFSHNSI